MGATRAARAGIAHSTVHSGQTAETAEENGIEYPQRRNRSVLTPDVTFSDGVSAPDMSWAGENVLLPRTPLFGAGNAE
jgi:hypothetical protein